MVKKNLKKKIILFIPIIAGLLLLILFLILRLSGCFSKGDSKMFTTSTLMEAVNIAELSTAQFTYNGIAEVYKNENSNKIKCRIRYEAKVKVGIEMNKIDFKIDSGKKTVKPILPNIQLTASIVDENKLSFIPDNSKIDLKEVLLACENDVKKEIESSTELFDSAEDNRKR